MEAWWQEGSKRIKGNLKGVVLTAGIHGQTKRCKTLYLKLYLYSAFLFCILCGFLKDVVMSTGIDVETKQCKTLFINTAASSCMLSSQWGFEKYRQAQLREISLGRNPGNGSLRDISGSYLWTDGVRKDRIVYPAEK